MDKYYVYIGWNITQGDGNHSKIGKSISVGNRKISLDTSYSVHGINFDFIIICKDYDEMSEIEVYLQDHFKDYSTMKITEHSAGLEWFRKRFDYYDIESALLKGNYNNLIVNDNEQLQKIIQELKQYEKNEKQKENEKYKKIIQEKENLQQNKNIYVPLKLQSEILSDSMVYYSKNDKGKIVIPCGTGKTVIGSFIGKRLESNRILIGVPSTLLIPQWEEKMISILSNHEIICITSKENPNSDNIYTTDTDMINRFLKLKKIIVITTYHSCYKIKDIIFNLKVSDECHHLVGEDNAEKGFKYFHSIESEKELYLTATIKTVDTKNVDSDKKLYTMNDSKIFGNTICEKNMKWAIDNKLITDYYLIALKNSEEDIINVMKSCNIEGNVELFLSAYMSLKSIIKYEKLSHIFIYSNSIENSKAIVYYISELLNSHLFSDFNLTDVYYNSLHSNSNCDIDNEIVLFKKSSIGIISCVYMFGEGYDLPMLNGVVFAENMMSEIRIVQSTTRCFRKDKNNKDKQAYVIIPYLDKDDWHDDNESFKKLRKITFQLRNEDANIEQKIKLLKIKDNDQKDYSISNIFQKWKKYVIKKNEMDIDIFIDDEEDDNNLNKLKLRLRKSKALNSSYESELHEHYDYMKQRNRKFNFTSKSDYHSVKDTDYIPNPEKYFELAWINWYDYWGYDTSYFIQTKDEWKKECQKNKILNFSDYEILSKNNLMFPKHPAEFYKDFTNIENELNTVQRRR